MGKGRSFGCAVSIPVDKVRAKGISMSKFELPTLQSPWIRFALILGDPKLLRADGFNPRGEGSREIVGETDDPVEGFQSPWIRFAHGVCYPDHSGGFRNYVSIPVDKVRAS